MVDDDSRRSTPFGIACAPCNGRGRTDLTDSSEDVLHLDMAACFEDHWTVFFDHEQHNLRRYQRSTLTLCIFSNCSCYGARVQSRDEFSRGTMLFLGIALFEVICQRVPTVPTSTIDDPSKKQAAPQFLQVTLTIPSYQGHLDSPEFYSFPSYHHREKLGDGHPGGHGPPVLSRCCGQCRRVLAAQDHRRADGKSWTDDYRDRDDRPWRDSDWFRDKNWVSDPDCATRYSHHRHQPPRNWARSAGALRIAMGRC